MYRPDFKTNKNGVPVLSKQQIEVIGENFVRDFCPHALKNPQPLDVEGFVEVYLGCKLDYQFLPHCGAFLGMMVFNATDKVIVYDPVNNRAEYIHADARTVIIDNTLLEDNQTHRYRFTLGHEAGHDILHSQVYAFNPNQISMFENSSANPMVQCRAIMPAFSSYNEWTDVDRMEWQSNYFSAVILMPAVAVRKLWENHKFKKKGDILEAFSMVSKTAATFNVSPEAARIRLEALGILPKGLVNGDVSFLGYGGLTIENLAI